MSERTSRIYEMTDSLEGSLGHDLDDDGAGRLGEDAPINLVQSRYIAMNDVRNLTNFGLLFLNAQSMNNKFQKIRDLTHKCSPAILCLQETWGKNSLTDYSIRGYHPPIILTRQGESMNLGGGVAVWIINTVEFTTIKTIFQEKTIETVGISIP